MKRIPDGTWVRIVKPDETNKNWIDDGVSGIYRWKDSIYWNPEMDEFNNKIFMINNKNYNNVYELIGITNFYWHGDWLIVAGLDKNSNPIPVDNEDRKNCYWCKKKTKTRIVKFKDRLNRKYTYCPECLR
jgi:hypothetical protein